MTLTSTSFFVVVVCLASSAFVPDTAEAKKRRSAPTCQSSARYGQLAANPPKYNFSGGVDRRVNPSFKGILTNVATKLKKSLTVTSGYRDCARNRSARGAEKSGHLTGSAVDVQSGSARSLASQIYNGGFMNGQVLWNSCNNHVHLAVDRTGNFDECGGKGNFKRKKKRRK